MRYITGVFFLLVVRAMLKWSSLKFFSRFADPSKGPAKEQLSVVVSAVSECYYKRSLLPDIPCTVCLYLYQDTSSVLSCCL